MDDNSWMIDTKPNIQEDGEISDSENDSAQKARSNGDELNKVNNLKKSTFIPPPTNRDNQNNRNNLKSKKVKKNQQFQFDYSNLSESELDEKFRQVYYQIQSIEAMQQPNSLQGNQSFFNGNQHSNNQPFFNQQVPANFNQQPNNYPDNQQSSFSQLNPQLNDAKQSNQFQQQMMNPKFKNNKKSNNKLNPSVINMNVQSIDPNDMRKLKSMFHQMSRILMKNAKQNKNGKKFSNKLVNSNNNKNQMNKKRKLISKNNSSNKRTNKGTAQNNVQSNEIQSIKDDSDPVIHSDLFPSTSTHQQNNKNQTKQKKSKKTNQVCRYFASGHCTKGNKCDFLHTKEKSFKVKDLCKFYVQGACDKGDSCIFMHKEFPCKFFHTGATCFDGENCKFSHEPLTEETSQILKQFLHPKDKKVEQSNNKDKVLLGTPNTEMQSSHSTWQWQQDLLNKDAKISDEFLIKKEPDFVFRKKLYTANECSTDNRLTDLEKIKRDHFDNRTEDSEVNASLNNQNRSSNLLNDNIYHRRHQLLSDEPKGTSYESKIRNIISHNTLHQLYNDEQANQYNPKKLFDSTYNSDEQVEPYNPKKSFNSMYNDEQNQYNPTKSSDSMFGSSDLINKLAQETKVNEMARQSADDKEQFSSFKKIMNNKEATSLSTLKFKKETKTSPVKSPLIKPKQSLLDEIMGAKGFVGSPTMSLGDLNSFKSTKSKQQANSLVVTSSSTEALLQTASLNEFSEFNDSKKQHDLLSPFADMNVDFTKSHINFSTTSKSISSSVDIESDDKNFIISTSPVDGFTFKLYRIDPVQINYNEYAQLYYRSEKTDPRLIKIFSSDQKSRLDPFQQLQMQTATATDDYELNQSMCGISGLLELKKIKKEKSIEL